MVFMSPVVASDGLRQSASHILQKLKIEQFELEQEMKLFGQPSLLVVFLHRQPLSDFINRFLQSNPGFSYADVIAGHVFLQGEFESAHAVLHLQATSNNSFKGELSLVKQAGHDNTLKQPLNVYREQFASRFVAWMPVGAQLLMDLEIPGKQATLQQVYLLDQTPAETSALIKEKLLAAQWLANMETDAVGNMGVWRKENTLLYVYVHALKNKTGVYLMKTKQAQG
ncbi:MAG: hypothetical protein GX070_01130 [Alcaligenaceae bacterium]|nr:hypothetical protein [Alcaligenaceae bacterium]